MRTLFYIAGLVAGTAVPAQAANWILDFEELQRGEIVTNQYDAGISGANGASVVISAVGGQANKAVVFDTHQPTTGGSGSNDGDPDLGQPFDNTSTDFGNILIVQESYRWSTSCGSSSCLGGGIIPDDNEGGGRLVFDFGDTPVTLDSIDYFDIESDYSQKMTLQITYADATAVSQQMPAVGNHDWGIFNFGSLGENVTKLVAIFKGSGAIDNLRGHSGGITSVPEPHSLALFLAGLIGLAFYRRRKPA